MTQARVCYLQTVDELVFNEPLDATLFRSEVARTAELLDDPRIEEFGVQILRDADGAGSRISNASVLPGNVAFVARLLQDRHVVGSIILETKRQTAETRACCARFEELCDRYEISIHTVSSDWRRFKGEQKLIEKAKFEFDILCKLRDEQIDVLMFDRAMFYSGLLIHVSSPIRGSVLNSHPGLLRGTRTNPGKSPIAEAYRRKSIENETSSTVSVHRADYQVDGGEIIAEYEFEIADVESATHLRTRVYSGLEAYVQCRAIQDPGIRSANWDLLRFPEVDEINQLYRAIVPP